MNLLINRINNGYNAKLNFVIIRLKKKYIPILIKLNELNYINSFNIKDKYLYVYLKYFKNKALFYLDCVSTSSDKKYLNKKYIFKNFFKRNLFNLNLFSTNKGIYDCNDLLIKCLGGKHLIKVNLLYKNIIS